MAKKFNVNDWRAKEDAMVLAQYQEIINDSKRRSDAIKAARAKAQDLEKQANAMKLACGGKLKLKKK